jgi:hypothetical protein
MLVALDIIAQEELQKRRLAQLELTTQLWEERVFLNVPLSSLDIMLILQDHLLPLDLVTLDSIVLKAQSAEPRWLVQTVPIIQRLVVNNKATVVHASQDTIAMHKTVLLLVPLTQ